MQGISHKNFTTPTPSHPVPKLIYLYLQPLILRRASTIQVMNMCQAFADRGIDLKLIVPRSRCDNRKIIYEEMKVPASYEIQEFRRYSLGGRPSLLGSYFGAHKALKENKHYSYCFTRDLFSAVCSVKNGFRTIYEIHDEKMHPSKILDRLYTGKFLRFAGSDNLVKIITISNALGDYWKRRGVPSEKISVLHDGFDSTRFEPLKSQAQARSELGIKTGRKIVIYVGSLYQDRGIEDILRLAKACPYADFMVIGGPEKRKRILESKALKEGLSNIAFLGRVPHYQVKDYLFAADILLMLWSWQVSTIRICSPLKVFEYMAAERLIVGQAFPTIKEILKDKETALLADPYSYRDLERKLQEALALGYPNQIAKNARLQAITKYSWQKRVENIVAGLA